MEEAYRNLLEAFEKFIEIYEKESKIQTPGGLWVKSSNYKLAVDNVRQNLRYIKDGGLKG